VTSCRRRDREPSRRHRASDPRRDRKPVVPAKHDVDMCFGVDRQRSTSIVGNSQDRVSVDPAVAQHAGTSGRETSREPIRALTRNGETVSVRKTFSIHRANSRPDRTSRHQFASRMFDAEAPLL
jgi:hypothetical protein